MSKRERRESKFYIEQDSVLISKRDKIRKYLHMWNVFPQSSTYIKIMGQKYNGEKDARLNDADVEVLNTGIDKVKKALDEFKQELNNGMDKS